MKGIKKRKVKIITVFLFENFKGESDNGNHLYLHYKYDSSNLSSSIKQYKWSLFLFYLINSNCISETIFLK